MKKLTLIKSNSVISHLKKESKEIPKYDLDNLNKYLKSSFKCLTR